MPNDSAVTHWLDRVKQGDEAGVEALWRAYFPQLVELARRRLTEAVRTGADEEDVALSAFDSFCRRAAQGCFPRLDDRDDLWQVLFMITVRKAADQANRERCEKRGGGRVVVASAVEDSASDAPVLAQVISREPDPAFAAEVGENCRRLLERLRHDSIPLLRETAVAKLEGYTNEEIAARLGISLPTVERKLRLIRAIWNKNNSGVMGSAAESGGNGQG